ncbi:MAG TPA: hypothetical protein VN794_18780 [Methylomirabilota bacterium]|nr:hypothetical protein [Methylomirabilota bacterium]
MAVTELKFTLSLEEANIVLSGLGELPAKTSLPVINKLQTQAAKQMVAEAPGPYYPKKPGTEAADDAAMVKGDVCGGCGAVLGQNEHTKECQFKGAEEHF